MDNFLNRLYRNPYAPLDAASITRVDDAGNGYDDWNNMIAPATAPHKQTWGEIGQNALMSPVRIGASLLDSINPYQANEHPITEPDASNWRVPPLATETWNAISAPGRAYYEGMSPEEMQHTAATAAGLMMGGGGITSGLESAAARGGVSLGDRVMAKYLDWKHPNTWQTPTPDVSSSKLAWRYGADLNTNDILQRYSPMEVRAGNMFGEPDLSKLNRYQTELLNKLTSDDARYADLNRRSMEAYGVGYEGLTPTQTRHIRDGIEPPKQKPSFSVIDGGLAANASKEAGAGALANALDMSPEARLARAREMGFDTDRVLYHGTGKTFDEFNPGTRGNGSQRRIYLTDNPDIADIYANSENYGLKGGGDPMIYPVFAKAEKPLIVSDKGADGSFGWVSDNLAAALGVERPGPGKYASLYEEAKRQGYDQVQIREMTDLGGPQTQYIPLKPEYIRSVNAAFDPSKSDSSNLLAANASKEAGAGAIANALDERPGIIAYHGSPHDFDKFDLSKIGTGEGAQAYGSGLYFAENEGVAKAYRDTLAPDHAKYAAGNYKAVYGDGALDAAMRDGDTVAAEYLKAEKEGTAKAPGHMYQVRINANPEDFLDWDKPLSQQNPNVIGLAKKMGIPLDKPSRDWAQDGTTWNLGTVDDYPLPFGSIKHRPTYNDYDTSYYSRGVGGGSYFKNLEDAKKWVETQIASIPDNRKGSDLYNSLSDDSVEASRLLKEAGVPGISYYDQLSRASPELDQLINGTRNHVLLDDSLIDILKKYGLAGMSLYGANNALSDKTTY